MWRIKLSLFMLFVGLLAASPAYGTKARVVFLSPDDSRYWAMVSGFMEAVADDLDIQLEVVTDYERHRFSYLKLASDVLSRPQKPDYLVFMLKEHVTVRMLNLAGKAGVKVFTFDTAVPEADVETLGVPRERLPHWIGHLLPDNVDTGERLALILRKKAEETAILAPETPLQVIALTGTQDSSAATHRNIGLLRASAGPDISLRQLVPAQWSEQAAFTKMRILLERYPEAGAVWSASDGMAFGAIQALKASNRRPGKDLVVGGVDWEPRAFDAIREGELAVSFGRHFLGGGLLLLLLHDYHLGEDFAVESAVPPMRYRMQPATLDNVDEIERVADASNWAGVDFTRFSRALNPDRGRAPLDINRLMDELVSALAATGGQPLPSGTVPTD